MLLGCRALAHAGRGSVLTTARVPAPLQTARARPLLRHAAVRLMPAPRTLTLRSYTMWLGLASRAQRHAGGPASRHGARLWRRAFATKHGGNAAQQSRSKGVVDRPPRWSAAWMWLSLKETAAHYWHGSKLLYADTRIAMKLFGRLLYARSLSRREHKLLVRVCADIARLVPLSFFVLVPMMEFALPFAIRLFPNLLPSTFEEKHHKDEKRLKLLKVRMEMAHLLQHTLDERASQVTRQERAKEKRKKEQQEEEAREAAERGEGPPTPLVDQRIAEARRWGMAGVMEMSADVREFMVRMKEGGRAKSTEELLQVMKSFKDNVTLDHLYRDQLVAMAQFLGMNHFTPTPLLRFQLRKRLRTLRLEDKDILWEGLDGISEAELKQDLRNRGLPTVNLSHEQLKKTLSDWLRLSQVKEIPYSLLILTNMLHFAGMRQEQKEASQLSNATAEPQLDMAAAQAALSSLPVELAHESTLIEPEEVRNEEKLEILRREEALIDEERQVQESVVVEESVEGDELRGGTDLGEKAAVTESERLSREQVADLADAIETMIDTPLSAEREEFAEIEADREAHRDEIEEAKSSSRQVAMLDSRVTSMLDRLRAEMEDAETTIGAAFHKLDLDGDGILSHAELVQALESLHLSKRPDATAFQELLKQIDVDGDGQIAVADFRTLMKEMKMREEEDYDSQEPRLERRKRSKQSATQAT